MKEQINLTSEEGSRGVGGSQEEAGPVPCKKGWIACPGQWEERGASVGGFLTPQEERQEQIRLLIKGNSASKTRLSRGPEEVR